MTRFRNCAGSRQRSPVLAPGGAGGGRGTSQLPRGAAAMTGAAEPLDQAHLGQS